MNEKKRELFKIYQSSANIVKELVKIKNAFKTLEKLEVKDYQEELKEVDKMLEKAKQYQSKMKEKTRKIREEVRKMRTEYAKRNNIEFEGYKGYCNRDTWLTIFWVNNCKDNYEYIKSMNKNSLNDTEFYKALRKCVYGDIINFNKVDLDEVRANLADEW